MSKCPDVLKSACNVFALMDMGMSEAAATRVAKQWEDKCAEVARLTSALSDVRDMLNDQDLPMHIRVDNACTTVAIAIELNGPVDRIGV